jgi:hypothetical protein
VLLLEAKNNATLRKILTLSPAMKDLRFTYIIPHLRPLPSSAMPDLHTVGCAAPMLSDLVPNRPIHSISLPAIISTAEVLGLNRAPVTELPRMGLADAEIIKQSTVDVRLLQTLAHFYFAVPFSEHFLHLEALELDFTHPIILNVNNICFTRTLMMCVTSCFPRSLASLRFKELLS